MIVLVTGSSGLIGSEAVAHYDRVAEKVVGVDNNMRAEFFGAKGDTTWNRDRLVAATQNFEHRAIDIRDREAIDQLFQEFPFDLIVHCAAQPSHDKAGDIPILDFEVNALGTLHLLEATRQRRPEAVFIHVSTNKVYGDAPNEIPLVERESRYDYEREADFHGVSEECRIDRCLHSLFGASKTAADVMAQEYGRYYGIKTGVFRGGCLTGPSHSGVELHGFLNYLAKAVVHDIPYTVFGYKGKQVRDNIHSADVIRAFDAFRQAPRPGEVYNLGGGRENSVSMMEAIEALERLADRQLRRSYQDRNRVGDHICYISDTRKFQSHYPDWRMEYSIERILRELVESETERRERGE